MSGPPAGQSAAAAGQQSLSARGRVGLGAAAGGFDSDLYGNADDDEKAKYAAHIADEEDEAVMQRG